MCKGFFCLLELLKKILADLISFRQTGSLKKEEERERSRRLQRRR
jgi:hypothetical protein